MLTDTAVSYVKMQQTVGIYELSNGTDSVAADLIG